ncbi:TPA: S-layer protein SlpA [Clostridioides difficile]|uniref:S-layer protein SlpA n=1 Tax=Clostridioides difficile TaxID=1496 RepID=UPI0007BB221A|nr:S-layer protein SlpA [Clostridioides difficile]EGT4217102.1 S-layer protein SlpA [Clostridioides difficile]MCR1519626.1 S-layer protein SlpA [Clostridioides difficile]CZR74367.1 precursor of the S-layer proteins [Clostridium difficile 630] [Clostridioides difficile]CZR88346.1 N-acetylmuramoyl-L-alanine amidase LytC precursor [Clostridioides difficile]CZS09332.1 N-acetylmuramoyl-L-alanine amidase LytC precursor [Clostridioides difficile]
MNKKNIAIAMSGLTVLASAAPVFAANDFVADSNYTVVQGKYQKVITGLQDAIKGGKIENIDVIFDGSSIGEVAPGSSEAEREAASAKLKNLVDDKLDNLGDGKYVQFNVKYNTKSTITKTELKNYYNKLQNLKDKTLISKNATDDVKGLIKDDTDGTAGDGVQADESLKLSDVMTFSYDEVTGVLTATQNTTNVTSNKVNGVKYGNTGTDGYDNGSEITVPATTSITAGTNTTEDFDLTDASKAFVFDSSSSTITGFVAGSAGESLKASIKIINAKEESIDVDSSSHRSAEDLAEKYVFVPKDVNDTYEALNDLYKEGLTSDLITQDGGKYQVVLFAQGKRLTTKGATGTLADENSPLKVTIKADKVKDLKDYVEDLKNANNGYSNSVVVAGEDRIETAIELSSKYYNSDDDNAITEDPVNNVVLVGSQAVVDGLVASPLASEKRAPLLLTSAGKLDSNVKAELKRVMDLKSTTGVNTSKKVYLAGGVNSISKDVENELKDMGLKVTRLSGDDRYETSLAIADEIGLDNDKAFVVGGTGLADAMSIAPVASQLRNSNGELDLKGDATPIVVVDGKAKDINSEVKDFLDDSQVDIIGGVNSVSKEVMEAIDDATGKSPERYSGEDRQATNAKVIKEDDFFKNGEVTNFFVAKDGSTKEDQLVDALAGAAIAGNFGVTVDNAGNPTVANRKASPAPIVLATDSLSSDQNVAISKAVNDDASTKNLVQVGKGIATSVVSKIKDLLDM